MKIFVYGTLRKGGRWHAYWLSDARFVGAGKISAELYQLPNGLPAVISVNRAQGMVLGEVYEITDKSTVDYMDQFERGAGYEPIEDGLVLMDNGTGQPIMARVYEYQGGVDSAERIISGDYIAHITRR